MDLTNQMIRRIENPSINASERARLRCQLAKELAESGNYEAAREAMGTLWTRIGDRPALEGLDKFAAAEVLLRVGILSGLIGSAHQVEGTQEIAKDLISESKRVFEELKAEEKVIDAQIDLAICYWREGALDEARILFKEVLSRIDDGNIEQKGRALLNSSAVEVSAMQFKDALSILTEASSLLDDIDNQFLKGNLHNQLAIVLKKLSVSENRADYIDRALVEYSMASYYFEQIGHSRFRARVENNLGSLLFITGKYKEAHEHLDWAQRLFKSVKDSGSIAQVNDTQARVFLAQGRKAEAEKFARAAVRTLEKGDELSLFAEALTTHGTALARLGRVVEARAALERALEVAEQASDNESVGLAAITIIEELGERISVDEMQALYERADAVLINSQNTETLGRLRSCARRIIVKGRVRPAEFSAPSFIYADARTGELLRAAHLVAGTQGAVLITGETGTGKEVLARLIHEWSGRTGHFVIVDCASLAETLLESQLFGHVKGSFTDALSDQAGAVREAAGGTLFLDNISQLSSGNQGKLLRLIERGEIHSIGASMPERVEVRVVASANCNLKEYIARREFRDDLFYRLSTFHLVIPPLRERPADISALAAHFIKELVERHGKRVTFTPEAVEAMQSLPLEGNAHELRALIERTVLAARNETVITRSAVEAVAARRTNAHSLADAWAGCSLKDEVLRFESNIVKLALETSGGSVTHAARLLGITHQRLCAMLQSRHKSLLLAKKATRPRKRRIITTLGRES